MTPGLGTVRDSGENSGKTGRNIRKRDIASYALLPKILPRIADLFFTGFHFFAFFMAQVYRGVRLLPADHPSLNPANVGQYGIRDIITAAARHLVWRKENIDQIIVFIAILVGLILLVLQAATFVVAIAMPQAVAATPSFGFSSIFGVPAGGASQDIAFILLDRVFGVPGIFNSCVSTTTPCYGVSPGQMEFDTATTIYKPPVFPWPYHNGLHAMFQFYSAGLLLVGVFILLYFVVVIVAETAQTGTPFGKRFNTVWAPIRLVMAFGLLIPITNGLNSAQYITLYAAKWGSNFATNGWIVFNKAINESTENMAQGMELTVKPKEPDAAALLQFMTLAHTCKVFEETILRPPPAVSKEDDACPANAKGRKIEAYLVKPGLSASDSQKFLKSTNYDDALKFAENGDIRVRFGDLNCEGEVEPICGQITLPTNSITETGAKSIQSGYYDMIKYMWGGYGSGEDIKSYENTGQVAEDKLRPERNACLKGSYDGILGSGTGSYDRNIRTYALYYFQHGVKKDKTGICNEQLHEDYKNGGLLPAPPENWKADAVQGYTYGADATDNKPIEEDSQAYNKYPVDSAVIIRNIIKGGIRDLQEAVAAGDYNISDENLRRGWAVAGVWYNKIAEMNGSLIGAAWDIPTPDKYPEIMVTVAAEKSQNNVNTDPSDAFCPNLAKGSINLPMGDNGKAYAQTMCQVFSTWNTEGRTFQPSGNAIADAINIIFGTEGLFDLRYQENNRSHPLAMLVGVGKSLIEASIRNLAMGLGAGVVGMVASAIPGLGSIGDLGSSISSFLFSIATMTLTAGFILFYVIPFLPFLYFFFAVGNWLKGVFEAMVGVPLWALAHLRIDGQGLPGEGAMNGYFMLFEIFLRPILILFGFLASITIFASMATVLHEVFEVAVENLTGANTSSASGAIDNFFYTVMYAVIMYIMALSSFKLIDLIPNQIMRWMGTSVSTFSDMQQGAAESLTNYTAIAGSQIVGGMTSGLQQGMKSIGQGGAGVMSGISNLGKMGKPGGG